MKHGRNARTVGAFVATVLTTAACSDGVTRPDPSGGSEQLSLEIVNGRDQQGVPGWQLVETIVLRVVDQRGDPVPGVRFSLTTADGGVVTPASATSSNSGRVTFDWWLGPASTRIQHVSVVSQDGRLSAEIEATALGPDESDLIILRGALGPISGAVLVTRGSSMTVLSVRAATDTLVYLPPDIPSGTSLIVFPEVNRPLMLDRSWSAAIDTAEAVLQPPVVVDVEVRVRHGDFQAQKRIIETQMANTADVWTGEGMGLTVGDVTFLDETQPPRSTDQSSSSACSSLTPGVAIRVDVITSIDNGQYTGWGCWAGRLYLAEGTDRYPYLLAHEFGHTFTLVHTQTGMMFPTRPGVEVREGEIFRAHFHEASSLNTIFASQPTGQRMNCSAFPSPCLPEALDLRAPTIIVAADAASPSDPALHGSVVDDVRDETRR